MSDSPLYIYSMPGNGQLATISPFSLKTETWLRLAGIPYEHRDAFFHHSPNGHLPFAEHRGERISESDRIIAYASANWGIDLDARLTPAERALATLLANTFEESFKFVRVYDTFAVEANYLRAKAYMGAMLPEEQREAAPAAMRAYLLEKLQHQGIALLTPREVHDKGVAIVDAAAHFLGDKAFFFGARPTSTDAIAYGFLATQVRGLVESPVSERVKGHANLVDFLARVDARCWT